MLVVGIVNAGEMLIMLAFDHHVIMLCVIMVHIITLMAERTTFRCLQFRLQVGWFGGRVIEKFGKRTEEKRKPMSVGTNLLDDLVPARLPVRMVVNFA